MATASGVIHDTPPATPNLFQEFRAFLDKYGVVGLAIAFVIGAALTQLVQAVVADVIMPVVSLALPAGGWMTAVTPGPVAIAWGHLLYTTIYFLIIAAFVFLVAKFLLREKSVAKK